MPESRDPSRPRSVDLAGTVLIAAVLVPFVFAVTEGAEWGRLSAPTLVCFVVSAAPLAGFVLVEKRVHTPLIDLALLRNKILVGSSVAILVAAGCINAILYICSLYFQNPDGLGMSPPEAGVATLPAVAGIVVTAPLITRFVDKVGARTVITGGFGIATAAFAVFGFADASWEYTTFVVPLVVLAVGRTLRRGDGREFAHGSDQPRERSIGPVARHGSLNPRGTGGRPGSAFGCTVLTGLLRPVPSPSLIATHRCIRLQCHCINSP